MRRIIDGKAYDTETAELVWGDPARDEEAIILYRNRHGHFFFFERYLVPCYDEDGNPQQELEYKITPYTDEHTEKWLQKHANELVEKYFGEAPEAGSAERRITLRMLDSLAKKLDEIAKTNATSLNGYINRCLERCVGEDGPIDGADAMLPPAASEKIMERSYQRSGMVAAGTLLSSGAKQATVAFTQATFDMLKLLADKSGVSFSEMVRQLVDIGLSGKGTAASHG